MPKTIAVVTDFESQLGVFLEENLRAVFQNAISVQQYYIDVLTPDTILGEDCILVMLENRIERIKSNIPDPNKVIVISRTILEEKALDILQIPEHSRVLVVNDYYETSLQLTALLYQLKIRDLEYITYQENKAYPDCSYAITCGIPENVPSYIENIIDIGIRVLDTTTFLQIMNLLHLNTQQITNSLLKYVETIVTIDAGMKSQFINLHKRTEQFKLLLEKATDGILLLSHSGEILLYNKKFQEMIGLNSNQQTISFFDLFDKKFTNECISTHFSNRLLKYKNKQFLVSTDPFNKNKVNDEKIIIFTDITHIKEVEKTFSKIAREKGLTAKYHFNDIIHVSAVMENCIEKAKLFAQTDSTVLIQGSSGTGKELFAQSIHNASSRKNFPFVAINCAAIPTELLESELFGYEKGAFTGANNEGKIGLFEQANHGTIFLDEIGDMPLMAQTKLLRVIQEKQIMRLGKNQMINIDTRIIAATNKNLRDCIDEGTFREDLYYRINVLNLNIPNLSERKEDIIPIFLHLTHETSVSEDIQAKLIQHNWNGNIRELSNIAEYYTLMKNTMFPLPDVFYEQRQFHLDPICIEIIHILNQHHHLGRSKLKSELEKRFVSVSEYELRKHLTFLSEQDYLTISPGRQGCQLKEKARSIICNAKNR